MVDITEFTGEDALRASLQKKRAKAQLQLDAIIAKVQEKITPLQAKIEKLDALIEILDGGITKKENDVPTEEEFSSAYIQEKMEQK